MSRRVRCKFFAHGACFKGEYCEFSHEWKAPPNNICTFYQKGVCSYGSRCRYNHVKVSRTSSIPSPSAGSETYLVCNNPTSLGTTFQLSASSKPFLPPPAPAWSKSDDAVEARIRNPSDIPICSFATVGSCPRGEKCPHVHGDLCSTCKKHCLHPFRPQEREEHTRACEKRQKHLEALKRSEEIECSVCLERVLSKAAVAERKFGLLSECDHPFCISCIRNWRGSSPSSGMDLNTALRACPICRRLSYFVIPSVIWYSSKEEKQDIIDTYKARLRCMDCKHFDFGNGTCPFGTSCFYRHAFRDGRLEEVVLRHLGDEDGYTAIAKNTRLSYLLNNLNLR